MDQLLKVLQLQQSALEKSGLFLRGTPARADFEKAGELLKAVKATGSGKKK